MRFLTKMYIYFYNALDGNRWGKKILIGVPYVWLSTFFLLPLFIIFKVSLSDSVLGVPPYKDLIEWIPNIAHLKIHLSFENYIILFEDGIYRYALMQSLKLASISTIFCLLLGYPMAYAISQAKEKKQTLLLLLVLLPFWTSFLLRVYAWIGLLSKEGILNKALIWLGLTQNPESFIGTNFSICLGMVYCYLPFMILPLYTALSKFDTSLLEAAADLGCPPLKRFFKITLPLSMAGIIAGCLLVFIPCVGEFVIPELLGGEESYVLGKVIWAEFFNNRDWPMASTIAIFMIVFMVLPIVFFQEIHNRHRT